jgi:hypothetical protein
VTSCSAGTGMFRALERALVESHENKTTAQEQACLGRRWRLCYNTRGELLHHPRQARFRVIGQERKQYCSQTSSQKQCSGPQKLDSRISYFKQWPAVQ